jgi:hypothetical protein
MTFTNRIKEIETSITDLEAHSMRLRNQICLLEHQEAKIANLIAEKRRQIDTIQLFNIKGNN